MTIILVYLLLRSTVLWVVSSRTYMALNLLVAVSFVSAVTDSPQCPDIHFPQSNGSPDYLLSFWCCCRLSPPSPDLGGGLRLGPVFHCCIPGSPDVYFRTPVSYENSEHYCPFHVSYDCVPCAEPPLHSGSSLCGPRSTFCGTPHRTGSVYWALGGALQLDASQHAASSVMLQFYLRPFVYGVSAAPLRSLFFRICLQIRGLRLPR
jgi:hypothetical protein